MSEPQLHRLHPSTILLEIVQTIKNWSIPIVLLFVFARGSGEVPWWLWMGIFFTSIKLGVTTIRYITLRYGVVGDRLVIRTGIVFRQNRTIPVDRIQNLHLKSGLLHRVFRVVEVRVETAGTGEAEAHLSVITQKRAEVFRSEVLQSRSDTAKAAEPAEDGVQVLRRARFKELLLAGATENRIGVLIAAIWGFYEFAGDLGADDNQIAEQVERSVSGTVMWPVAVAMLAGGFILCGWVASILWTLITYHGFMLTRSGTDLRKRHGLLTRFESTIPIGRIQVLRLEASLLRRAFEALSIRVETAGSKADEQQGGTTLLCPLLSAYEAEDFCRYVYPDTDINSVVLEKLPLRAARRKCIRVFLFGGCIATGCLIAGYTWPWWFLPGWAAFAVVVAWRHYRVVGYGLFGRFLYARSGIITRKWWVVPQEKVQAVRVQQSPLQRWMNLATLHLATAGGGSLSQVEVVDMTFDEADRIFETLSRAAARGGGREGL
ncbi:MAG: hypothetical protein CMJ83_09010 [Planctomycetes bacterium]|nr:hypothetical protein [Planctomycetota bacterium]